MPCGPVHPWQLGLSSIASLRCPFRPRTGIEDPFLLSRSPIVAALLALVLDPLITLRIKILLLRFHPGPAFLFLFIFTRRLGIRHLTIALDTVLDKTLKKCVLKSGPDCPTGQRYNPATRSCVLLLGDCLEFEFCPVITSSVPAL